MNETTPTLDRRAVVASVMTASPESLIVTGLGSATYDVHAAEDRATTFYLWGAMGAAALTGLGLAQARPDKRVLVLTGDGEQLMALGGLATIATAKPRNLDIVILDNEHFGETGMQASHTHTAINLARVAESCGFAETETVWDMAGVERIGERLGVATTGPRLFVVKVKAENLPRSMPARDAVFIKNRFRGALGLLPS